MQSEGRSLSEVSIDSRGEGCRRWDRRILSPMLFLEAVCGRMRSGVGMYEDRRGYEAVDSLGFALGGIVETGGREK